MFVYVESLQFLCQMQKLLAVNARASGIFFPSEKEDMYVWKRFSQSEEVF